MKFNITKIITFLSVLFLVSISCTFVFASDIVLPGIENENQNVVQNNTTNQPVQNETQINNNQQNNETISNTENDGNNESDQNVENQSSEDTSNIDNESLTPTVQHSAPESGLGISNIINILVITVGVVLILLAIAIILRLKK